MEVYVDDMLVKFIKKNDHIAHLDNMFKIARAFNMKFNPLKCTFGVQAGKFLGFVVHQ